MIRFETNKLVIEIPTDIAEELAANYRESIINAIQRLDLYEENPGEMQVVIYNLLELHKALCPPLNF